MGEVVFLVFLVGWVPAMVEITEGRLVDLHGGAPHDRVGRLFKGSFLVTCLEHVSIRLWIPNF